MGPILSMKLIIGLGNPSFGKLRIKEKI